MATVLITGGAGFIGRHCAREFLNNYWTVKLLDTKKIEEDDELVISGCIPYVGDIQAIKSLENAMSGCDAVVHLAALVSVPKSIEDPQSTFDVNEVGTRNVLRCASKMNVGNTIVASSAAVYGDHPDVPLKESASLQFLSPYAESKAANERDVERHRNKGMNAIALRFFNVYGPGQHLSSGYASLIPTFVDAMLKGNSPTIYGDGTQTRDFIHVTDLAEAVFALADCDEKYDFPIANVASESQISVNEVVETINQCLKSTHKQKEIVPLYSEPREGDILHSFGSKSRLEEMINWKPKTEFKQGITSLIESLQRREVR